MAKSNDTSGINDKMTNMGTSQLEQKLVSLRKQSNEHSQLLTQRLATSKSGQNLLHIGSSLSTLPPDLHTLSKELYPAMSSIEKFENEQYTTIKNLVSDANEIRYEMRKIKNISDCSSFYVDLCKAEEVIEFDVDFVKREEAEREEEAKKENFQKDEQDEKRDSYNEEAMGKEQLKLIDVLDHVSSLERTAHTTLILVDELQKSTQQISDALIVTNSAMTNNRDSSTNANNDNINSMLPSLKASLQPDTERAQFIMKLSSRIRKLESSVISALTYRMEVLLKQIISFSSINLQSRANQQTKSDDSKVNNYNFRKYYCYYYNNDDRLLILGSIMRGLALLGRGPEVENIFARIAIMPLIRTKVSMGRLDEGGSRGECTGLSSLLDDMITSISTTFGNVLIMSELMFQISSTTNSKEGKSGRSATINTDVDLITCGVWVPIVTTLMADAGIKMAIFSPGIANILQSNYLALDKFVKNLAKSLLVLNETTSNDTLSARSHKQSNLITKEHVQNIQFRLYQHSKTIEFYKKWNLPIYYQLRFGECCTRLNNATYNTIKDGWLSNDAYTGDDGTGATSGEADFVLPFFRELYDMLSSQWRKEVILTPLTDRFLRGGLQLLSRSLSFISDGIDGKIQFGVDLIQQNQGGIENRRDLGNNLAKINDVAPSSAKQDIDKLTEMSKREPFRTTRTPYYWSDSEGDVGAVTWELSLLESKLSKEFIDLICSTVQENDECDESSISNNERQNDDSNMRSLVSDLIRDVSNLIDPLISKAWNSIIVSILINKCAQPLAAVKGVAATYRMTNRPPPTRSSPFVTTILRPLQEFCNDFHNRIPAINTASSSSPRSTWKFNIISTVSDKYSLAIEELLQTVQRTEVALKNRKSRRTIGVGGTVRMSDGEKVKLQLFLDYQQFYNHAKDILELKDNDSHSDTTDADQSLLSMTGIEQLKQLTKDGQELFNSQKSKK